jgi:hypothetical protein
VFLAAIDIGFGGDEDRFVAHVYDQTKELLASPLYAFLIRLAGTERVVRGIAARWSQFQRGVSLTATVREDHGLRCDYGFPPHLIPPVIARCWAQGMRATLELSGAHDVTFDIETQTPERLVLEGRWRQSPG